MDHQVITYQCRHKRALSSTTYVKILLHYSHVRRVLPLLNMLTYPTIITCLKFPHLKKNHVWSRVILTVTIVLLTFINGTIFYFWCTDDTIVLLIVINNTTFYFWLFNVWCTDDKMLVSLLYFWGKTLILPKYSSLSSSLHLR